MGTFASRATLSSGALGRSRPALTVPTIASPTDVKPRSSFHFADYYGEATDSRWEQAACGAGLTMT
jgi:hypothetical protein